MASTILQRTLGTPTNRKKLTASMWLKKSFNAAEKHFFGIGASGGYLDFRFASTGELELYHYTSGYQFRLTTTRKFRDTNAWYHLVFAIDTTLGTADDRFKVYVNGVQETVFTNRTNPSQDYELGANVSGNTISVGNYGTNTGNSFDGLISHLHFSDGYVYQASDFGESDSVSGIWKPKTSPSVTYGTNGFFILKDGNSVTDQSGEGNNFTVANGTLTNTEDCPGNVFATMATPTWYDGTIANGGNTVTTNQTNYIYQGASLGVNKGKWYWEVKFLTAGNYMLCGITDQPNPSTVAHWVLGSGAYDYAIYYGNGSTGGGNGHLIANGGAGPSNTPGQFMGALSAGDIMTFALDCDNNTLKIGTNGNWANGSNATDQTFANTTAKAITAVGSTNTGFYFPGCGDYSSATSVLQYNFGNGYFGTTAVSSAGTNASNLGIFEYDVPTGYTALCTKGLNE